MLCTAKNAINRLFVSISADYVLCGPVRLNRTTGPEGIILHALLSRPDVIHRKWNNKRGFRYINALYITTEVSIKREGNHLKLTLLSILAFEL